MTTDAAINERSAPAAGDAGAPLEATDVLAPQDAGITSLVSQFLDTGGPVLWVLGVLSVLTLALILAKLMQFRVVRLGSRAKKAPLQRIEAVAQSAYERHGHDRGVAEDAGRREARAILRPLESGLGTLGMIAMLSPLIGLLGTVIGMISAFQALEAAGSTVDPALLSAGIWVALLTTAAGLIVAIPATLAHGWFEGRLGRFADEAECRIGDALLQVAPHEADLRIAAE